MKDEDRNFIFNSWLRSFRKSHYAGPIPYNLYYDFYQKVIEQILRRDGVEVKVAVPEEHPSQIIGYCVLEHGFEKPVVHYCYVKQGFRGMGFAKRMVGTTDFFYTFRTPSVRWLPSANFVPAIVRRPKERDETQDSRISDAS